ncbi:MAG TPA: class I SAM-dependent methyltransferase [Patescibacteria group bacterium]|nr:class I SAM-dependent methyltransferase [Patescibacteria group bacterium]
MPETTNYTKHSSKNPIQRLLIDNFYRQLFKTLKPVRPVKILDVGCGEGITIVRLSRAKIGKSYEGVDNSEDAIKIGKKQYPNINIKIGDIYKLPYKDNSFDLLICTEVLEHLEDPAAAVKELRRVTSKYVVFSVPNEPFFMLAHLARGQYITRFGNHPEHINHWTNPGFKSFLRKNHYKISASKAPFAWTLVLAKK